MAIPTRSRTRHVAYALLSELILFPILCMPSPARAQAVYGSVSGIITDASGAVVPGVTVTITSVERKTSDAVTSNESGHYLKERLRRGTYEVKAELPGFKGALFPAIKVTGEPQEPFHLPQDPGP